VLGHAKIDEQSPIDLPNGFVANSYARRVNPLHHGFHQSDRRQLRGIFTNALGAFALTFFKQQLTHANVFRGDFNQLVIVDEFERLL